MACGTAYWLWRSVGRRMELSTAGSPVGHAHVTCAWGFTGPDADHPQESSPTLPSSPCVLVGAGAGRQAPPSGVPSLPCPQSLPSPLCPPFKGPPLLLRVQRVNALTLVHVTPLSRGQGWELGEEGRYAVRPPSPRAPLRARGSPTSCQIYWQEKVGGPTVRHGSVVKR